MNIFDFKNSFLLSENNFDLKVSFFSSSVLFSFVNTLLFDDDIVFNIIALETEFEAAFDIEPEDAFDTEFEIVFNVILVVTFVLVI